MILENTVKAVIETDPTALMLQCDMHSHLCASNKQIAFPVEPAITRREGVSTKVQNVHLSGQVYLRT